MELRATGSRERSIADCLPSNTTYSPEEGHTTTCLLIPVYSMTKTGTVTPSRMTSPANTFLWSVVMYLINQKREDKRNHIVNITYLGILIGGESSSAIAAVTSSTVVPANNSGKNPFDRQYAVPSRLSVVQRTSQRRCTTLGTPDCQLVGNTLEIGILVHVPHTATLPSERKCVAFPTRPIGRSLLPWLRSSSL